MKRFRLLTLAALAAACTNYVDVPTRNLVEQATVYVAPDDSHVLVAVLSLENTGPTPLEIMWSLDCVGNGPVRVRAYRATGAATTLAWDSARLPFIACPTAAHRDTIMPAGIKAFQARIPMAAILGDSLPAANYRFTVLAALLAPALPNEVEAGSVALIAASAP